MSTNSPIPPTRLRQITTDACDSALSTATNYEHSQTQAWNESIVNKTLQALISESSNTGSGGVEAGGVEASGNVKGSKWKFVVNATIIQHLSDSPNNPASTTVSSGGTQTGDEGAGQVEAATETTKPSVGRRGMHSASGAYWNNERDGMWSHKYTGAENKGMDVVVNVVWIGA